MRPKGEISLNLIAALVITIVAVLVVIAIYSSASGDLTSFASNNLDLKFQMR